MKPKAPALLRQIEIPERHRALGLGMYHGMRNWRIRPAETPEKPLIEMYESHYALGYAVGTLTQALVVIIVATYGAGGAVPVP